MQLDYIETTKDLYKEAALNPEIGLCCTTNPVWQFPDLNIPKKMIDMNYGCGTTVNPRDLINNPNVLYVGVGGGMELLQFAYFSRKNSGVIGIDIVDEMIESANKNISEAESQNKWFSKDFINIKKGNALSLPIEDSSVDVAAQNCLFNIFKTKELKVALNEMHRVLKKNGKLVMSDPVCEQQINSKLKNDNRLRAACLTGAIPINEYINMISGIGFGTIEIRAKRPYRVLNRNRYPTKEDIFIESIEVCAIKDPMPKDGPCVFTGKTAIYYGNKNYFDDGKGHVMLQNQPLSICDKTASNLAKLKKSDLFISESTFFYDGGGCC